MNSASRRFSLALGFSLLLILLILNALIIRRQLGLQFAAAEQFEHSQQILLALDHTESLVRGAESGQRGFLYTGTSSYLSDYQNAAPKVSRSLDDLERLMGRSPVQQARVSQLRGLCNQKLIELAQTISLYQAGRSQDATSLVKTDRGLVLMNSIRNVAGQITREESDLANAKAAESRRNATLTVLCVYLTSALTAFGLAFLTYFELRHQRLRECYSRQIEEREEWFRSTLTSLGDAVIATDSVGTVTFLNPIAEHLLGLSFDQSRGRQIQEIFPIFNESSRRAVENPILKVMNEGNVIGLANHTILLRPDGTYIPIEDSAAPIRDGAGKLIGVVLVFRDATQERKTEELMRKTEKLAAAARLASTMAHEINNPLEAIGNLLFISQMTAGLPETVADHLGQAQHELERVAHLTKQTLGFYRESKVPELIPIPELIDSVLKIYTNKLAVKSITVLRDFKPCPPVQGLTGELRQVLANLISNAADAVGHNGTIRIVLTCVEEGGKKTAEISVEDNGSGVPHEHVAQIFEPFFTTKKDVGTGLGLWVVKEIVERHGGTIGLKARGDDSTGAVFDVRLPLSENAEASEITVA